MTSRSGSSRRLPLAALVLSTVAVALGYGAAFLPGGAPAWAAWLLAVGTAAMMVAVMALGAARGARRGGGSLLGVTFALTFVVLAGSFAFALAPPAGPAAAGAGTPLWLGLPPRTAVVIYGVGLLPMLFLPFAYARAFDESTLGAGDVERVRRARAAREAWGAPPRDQDDAGDAADRHRSVAARSDRVPPPDAPHPPPPPPSSGGPPR